MIIFTITRVRLNYTLYKFFSPYSSKPQFKNVTRGLTPIVNENCPRATTALTKRLCQHEQRAATWISPQPTPLYTAENKKNMSPYKSRRALILHLYMRVYTSPIPARAHLSLHHHHHDSSVLYSAVMIQYLPRASHRGYKKEGPRIQDTCLYIHVYICIYLPSSAQPSSSSFAAAAQVWTAISAGV